MSGYAGDTSRWEVDPLAYNIFLFAVDAHKNHDPSDFPRQRRSVHFGGLGYQEVA